MDNVYMYVWLKVFIFEAVLYTKAGPTSFDDIWESVVSKFNKSQALWTRKTLKREISNLIYD